MVGLFGIIGVPPATSLAVSVVLGLLATAISVPGLLFWMRRRRQSAGSDAEATSARIGVEGMKA